jgi:hypothetical protein
MDQDTRIIRERQAIQERTLDASESTPPDCNGAMVAQTTTVTTYPTTASAFYGVIPQAVNGTESEGTAATYIPYTGAIAYALNLGTAIPPSGTNVVCHAVGGRWCFRYD